MLTSEKTNTFHVISIHVLFRHHTFLSIFWPVEITWEVTKSLTTHLACGQGSRLGNWRYVNFILVPASASPAIPLCGCLLHGCYFSPAEEAINQQQTVTVSGMRKKKKHNTIIQKWKKQQTDGKCKRERDKREVRPQNFWAGCDSECVCLCERVVRFDLHLSITLSIIQPDTFIPSSLCICGTLPIFDCERVSVCAAQREHVPWSFSCWEQLGAQRPPQQPPIYCREAKDEK